ncbi:c-type cytochrome [Pedobacter sp. B4-66]|uniref:c-type cytochrome n=1 Tax=Pedobacter sp. B4-66 TaxID=2817280 RepID=UPI002023D2AC|nr:c-type cytochrome [Pedobacter sp. B4-66]
MIPKKVIAATVLFEIYFAVIGATSLISSCNGEKTPAQQNVAKTTKDIAITPKEVWQAPDESTIPKNAKGEMIRYGKDLIANTSAYFGPKGRLGIFTNGLNCQNCHLDGGTRIFANNYAAVMSSYPKVTARSGKVTSPVARIKGCFERSLNGKMPDSTSKEIRAMIAYMEWLNQGVKDPENMYGRGTEKIALMDRPADPKKGALLYSSKCQSCHGGNGEGIAAAGGKTFIYPPLWGKLSYNDGAGIYRLSNFAGFIKNNMPFGATYKNPILTDEESWDIAAFVNSQARPHKDQKTDYPDLKKKPIDAPYGPYGDQFSEKQHKYGPFQPIKNTYKTKT